jgi:hypothetical protein
MMQLYASADLINIVTDLVDHERDDYGSNFDFVRHVIMQPFLDVKAVDYNAHRERRQKWKIAIPRFLKLICRQPDMTCSNEEIDHELLLDKLNKEQLKAGIIKAFLNEGILGEQGYFKFSSSLY